MSAVIPTLDDFEKMHDFVAGRAISSAVYVAAKLNVADYLQQKPYDFATLASELEVDAKALYRLLRALASIGVFKELDSGTFTLTPLAATMCSDTECSLKDLIIMCGDPWHWQLWGGLLYSVSKGGPYFEHHFETDFFSYIKEHTEVAQSFNAAMMSLSSLSNYVISERIDFSKTNTVVDVGGGNGGLLISILKKYPRLSAILFDLPQNVESSKSLLQTHKLHERCQVKGGDFFKSVPAGGDTYIIKHVFHGLSDDQCISVLNNIKAVGVHHNRILIIEMMMPESNEPSYSKFNDLEMMLMSKTGKERSRSEFIDLINQANLSIAHITPIHLGLSIIEVYDERKA